MAALAVGGFYRVINNKKSTGRNMINIVNQPILPQNTFVWRLGKHGNLDVRQGKPGQIILSSRVYVTGLGLYLRTNAHFKPLSIHYLGVVSRQCTGATIT